MRMPNEHCIPFSYALLMPLQWVLSLDEHIDHTVDGGQDYDAATRNRVPTVLPYDHNRCSNMLVVAACLLLRAAAQHVV